MSPSAFAQGSLTPPPGAPAPTMKTLDQIASTGIAVNNTNTPGDANNQFIINQPGSYFFTGNITGVSGKNGILISAINVTLDLNGFALSAVGGSMRGIDVAAGTRSLCIRNGSVTGWYNGGVRADTAINSLLEKLRVYNNGGGPVGDGGIVAGLGSTIRDCVAYNNTSGPGIGGLDGCTVVHCTCSDNYYAGIVLGNNSTVTQCTAAGGPGDGILVGTNSSVLHCTASGNGATGIQTSFGCTVADCTAGGTFFGNGIAVDFGSTVRNCTARFNGKNGIVVTSGCYVVGNTCDQNNQLAGGYAGVFTSGTGTGNRFESNSSTYNNSSRGFYILGAGNLIIRNSATGNTTNYHISANNKVGVIVLAPDSGAISGSTGGAGVGTTDPWANFSY